MKFWHHFLYFSLQLFTFFCYQSPISSIHVSNANNLNALEFLPTTYHVKNDRTFKEFCVRQVPGMIRFKIFYRSCINLRCLFS